MDFKFPSCLGSIKELTFAKVSYTFQKSHGVEEVHGMLKKGSLDPLMSDTLWSAND
ncbi:hypothetical protein A2U01_0078787, partial [Trifolium medium]|nr:hypothetical protein [Trifolium medium]